MVGTKIRTGLRLDWEWAGTIVFSMLLYPFIYLQSLLQNLVYIASSMTHKTKPKIQKAHVYIQSLVGVKSLATKAHKVSDTCTNSDTHDSLYMYMYLYEVKVIMHVPIAIAMYTRAYTAINSLTLKCQLHYMLQFSAIVTRAGAS